MHFKSFVRSLEEKNCDMSSLSVSKSVSVSFIARTHILRPLHPLTLTLLPLYIIYSSSPLAVSRNMVNSLKRRRNSRRK
ncbi:hypothetical protein T439DRAFT_326519 [Meredithblackwellia eburnea MCA 4105]